MNLRIWSFTLILFLSLSAFSQKANKYLVHPLPVSWTEADTVFQQILPIDDHWWKAFEDPMLDSLISVAVKQNYSVLTAINRMDMAKANLRIERGSYYPSLALSGGWTKQQTSGNTSSIPQAKEHYFNAALSTSWEADIFGSIRNRVKAQKETFMASQEEYNATMVSLCAQVASGYINAIAKGKLSKLTPVWKNGLSAIYDTYLGACPEKFTYKGKEYTPKTFSESLGLNCDDYVSLTSYTHHPFYSQFAIEIQDNWRNGLSYNLPIEELMAVMDNAVKKGYTFAWGSDVSEQGFTRDGIAVMPDVNKESELSGSDMARWTGLTAANKRQMMTTKPYPEIDVTQEMRQVAFDNWETTDDHGMVIYGIAKDQNGKEYFMVKNSWGKSGKYNGIWYASKAFVAYKTMNILVHKDALPKEIAKKLGIK